MAFKLIEGIDLGQGAGNAFGGGIYSSSCQIGFSNHPTRINLGVVRESGNFPLINPSVTSNPYNIDFNGQVFSGMYLTSFDRTKTSDSHLLSLNFIDSSFVLDKIQIGLLNRHGNKYKETIRQTGEFSVRCQRCNDGVMASVGGLAIRHVDRIPTNSGCYFEKNLDGGGYIIVGKEAFPDTNCEIPKVDYNFTELCSAMKQFGIAHDLLKFDINQNYRQEYVGTLREVLNSWGSDFGFEFFYENNNLKGIDLRKEISISSIKSFAETNEYVNSFSYGETLENSYSQSVVARYMKASRAKEYNNSFYYRKLSSQIYLEDILKNQKCAGRNADVTKISVALGRLDPTLREAYIANYAVENNDREALESLGFFNVILDSQIADTTKSQIIAMSKAFNNSSDNHSTDNYYVVFGHYRDDLRQSVTQWDSSASEFIGKYYYHNATIPQNMFGCPSSADGFRYYSYDSKWQTLPASQVYGNDSVPFQDILRNPITNTNLSSVMGSKNIFSVEDNAWGTSQEVYDADRGIFKYSLYGEVQIVTTEEMIVPGQLFLDQLSSIAPQDAGFISSLNGMMTSTAITAGAKVACMIIPRLNANNTIFPSIGPLGGLTVNNSAYDRVISRQNDNEESAAACKTYCDFDIVSDICDCGTKSTPTPYFKNLLAPYFNIRHPNGNVTRVVFPVNADYWAYLENTRYFKTTYPPIKSIYGTPDTKRTETLTSRMLDYDITPDLGAIFDYNNAVNENIFTSNGTITTAEEYYKTLSNMSDIVIPPQKTIKMSIARTDLATLGLSLLPSNGLTEFSMSIGQEGVSTELTYATRPPFIPKPDVALSRIKYRLKT